MPHYTRIETDATWTTGNYQPTEADLEAFESNLFHAVNAADGGTWWFVGNTTLSGSFSASPVVVLADGAIQTNAGATGILLSDNDYPEFAAGHALRTRTIVTDCVGQLPATFPQWSGLSEYFSTMGALKAFWAYNATYASTQSVACTYIPQDNANSAFFAPDTRAPFSPELVVPLRVHNGSTLSQVVLSFRVATARTKAPATMPQLRIVRRDASGNMVVLKSTATDALGFTADGNGFISPAKPASGAAWYAGGGVQTLTYVCDQNNVIDVSQYTYEAHLIEEGGATDFPIAVHLIDPVLCASGTNVGALSGTPMIDGVATANGDRVLLLQQTSAAQNGTWIAGGTWTTDPDLNLDALMVYGAIVPVQAGTTYGGSVWQFQTPRPPPAS